MHFSYCRNSKSYLIVLKSGRGINFSLDKNQIVKINEFLIQY